MYLSSAIMKLQKLNQGNEHLAKVVDAMCERHSQVYGFPTCEVQTRQYCIDCTYAMVNDNNELIGFASISRVDTTYCNWLLYIVSYILSLLQQRVFIYDVYIFPCQRKKGHGTNLINLVYKEIATNYVLVQNIYLHCKPSLAYGFYLKAGFETSDILTFNNERLILMKKRLEI
jgi:ribosomal protein S18 acetylase RimI-like enzyme